MGMNITNCWKLFRCGVKRYHYEKLISIRELSQQLSRDFFKNPFLPYRGTPAKNTPPLDDVDYGDIVSTFRALHFSSCIFPFAAVITISDMTLNSDSLISIGSHNIYKK